MFNGLIERYNSNKRFQKSIWDIKVFEELTERQEIVIKIIYFLENVFKEDLKNICFYLYSDDAFDTTLKKLRNEGYIFFKRNGMGTIYALTNKSISLLQPFNVYYTSVRIGDKELYANKIKGAIIAKQINAELLDNLKTEFLNYTENQAEIYLLNQFIKNFRFKDFIKKTESERIFELKQLNSLNEKDKNDLLRIRTYNEKLFKIYNKVWNRQYKTIQLDDRYLPFREKFKGSLYDDNYNDELRYLLKDFSKKVLDTPWDEVIKSFLSEDIGYKEEYITKQYIKHRRYKRFLDKQDGDQVVFLTEIGFNKEEIKQFFNLTENDKNRINMLYVKRKNFIDDGNYNLFINHFYNQLEKEKSRFHSEYLSDYKRDWFPNIEDIMVNYFKSMTNNYLKDSNSKIISSFVKVLEGAKIDTANFKKINTLEKLNTKYGLLSYYERSVKKSRNDFLKKQDNDLVDEKNKELEEVQKELKDLKSKIAILENDLSITTSEKENGQVVERAFTFKTLQRNSIYIDGIKKGRELVYGQNLNTIEVDVSILDNTENGLQPFLMFKKIFIIQTFLNQLIDREGFLDLNITIYTFNKNRKELLDQRLVFTKDKMDGYKGEFASIRDNIKTENTTILNYKLWEFYNRLKEDIEIP